MATNPFANIWQEQQPTPTSPQAQDPQATAPQTPGAAIASWAEDTGFTPSTPYQRAIDWVGHNPLLMQEIEKIKQPVTRFLTDEDTWVGRVAPGVDAALSRFSEAWQESYGMQPGVVERRQGTYSTTGDERIDQTMHTLGSTAGWLGRLKLMGPFTQAGTQALGYAGARYAPELALRAAQTPEALSGAARGAARFAGIRGMELEGMPEEHRPTAADFASSLAFGGAMGAVAPYAGRLAQELPTSVPDQLYPYAQSLTRSLISAPAGVTASEVTRRALTPPDEREPLDLMDMGSSVVGLTILGLVNTAALSPQDKAEINRVHKTFHAARDNRKKIFADAGISPGDDAETIERKLNAYRERLRQEAEATRSDVVREQEIRSRAFSVLGLPETATRDQIKSAYRHIAKTLHPDVPSGDPEKFKELQIARDTAYNMIQSSDMSPQAKQVATQQVDQGVQQEVQRTQFAWPAGTTPDPSMEISPPATQAAPYGVPTAPDMPQQVQPTIPTTMEIPTPAISTGPTGPFRIVEGPQGLTVETPSAPMPDAPTVEPPEVVEDSPFHTISVDKPLEDLTPEDIGQIKQRLEEKLQQAEQAEAAGTPVIGGVGAVQRDYQMIDDLEQRLEEIPPEEPVEAPTFKREDRVSWTTPEGEELTGTVRSVIDYEGLGTMVSVHVDQISMVAGRPVERVESVSPGRLTMVEEAPVEEEEPTVASVSEIVPGPKPVMTEFPLTGDHAPDVSLPLNRWVLSEVLEDDYEAIKWTGEKLIWLYGDASVIIDLLEGTAMYEMQDPEEFRTEVLKHITPQEFERFKDLRIDSEAEHERIMQSVDVTRDPQLADVPETDALLNIGSMQELNEQLLRQGLFDQADMIMEALDEKLRADRVASLDEKRQLEELRERFKDAFEPEEPADTEEWTEVPDPVLGGKIWTLPGTPWSIVDVRDRDTTDTKIADTPFRLRAETPGDDFKRPLQVIGHHRSLEDAQRFVLTQEATGRPAIEDLRIKPDDEPTTDPTKAKARLPETDIAGRVHDMLEKGRSFSWRDLFAIADTAYQGTQAEGVYTPKDAYDAMELGINKYILSHPGRFPTHRNIDYTHAVKVLNRIQEDILDKIPTQTKRTGEGVEFQQFSTPPNIAYLANWAASIMKQDIVLEPSAGIGGLAVFPKGMQVQQVMVNELSDRRANILREMGFDAVYTENAEHLHAILHDKIEPPSLVVMNPPFSSTAGRLEGVRDTRNVRSHMEEALKLLRDDGRLVAILGEGMALDKPAHREWWEDIQERYNVRANIGIDGSEYRKYGTSFGVQLVVIDKDGPTTETPVTGQVKDVRQAVPMLRGVKEDRKHISVEPDPREPVSPPDPEPGVPEEPDRLPSEERPGIRTVPGEPAPPRDEPETRPDVAVRPGDERDEPVRDVPDVRPDEPVPEVEPPVEAPRPGEPTGPSQDDARPKPKGSRHPAVRGPGDPDKLESGNEPDRTDSTLRVEQREDERRGKLSDNIFTGKYKPSKLKVEGAKEHPAQISETAAMADSEPPDITYAPDLPKELIESGDISESQLEAVVYAGQSHQKMLPSGVRQGHMIGDGTGTGKGRTIAAIILDNLRQGRDKAVWISASWGDMHEAAKRDIRDVGQHDPEHMSEDILYAQNDYSKNDELDPDHGIFYTTYSMIRGGYSVEPAGDGYGTRRIVPEGEQTRLEQLMEWLDDDFDGVIVFDESHKMQNASGIEKEPSLQAMAGLRLQEAFPEARIEYSSATAFDDPETLAYAERLGLWGEGTPFASMEDFVEQISASGLGGMELIARDSKQKGAYLSRQISYEGIEYDHTEHRLTEEQIQQYNVAAEAWQILFQNMSAAMESTGAGESPQAKRAAKSQFYGTYQRFWSDLLTAMKMPTLIESIEKDLEQGYAPVIQVDKTGEASMGRELQRIRTDPDMSLQDFNVSPTSMIMDYVERAFPTTKYEPVKITTEDGKTRTVWTPVRDSEGNTVKDPEAVRLKNELLAHLGGVRLPKSPIDMLVDSFGKDRVSEITGRKERVLEDEEGNKYIDTRGTGYVQEEVRRFLDDEKHILLFSKIGNTGVDYHAGLNFKNQRLRRHYLLEPSWDVKEVFQGFGRTHRSFQKQPPEYILVTTNLKGEKRFLSTVAQRLNEFGALSRGERGAESSGLFHNEDDLSSPFARDALMQMYINLSNDEYEFIDEGLSTISERMGIKDDILTDEGNLKDTDELRDTKKFLNRILGLEPHLQNQVFEAFEVEHNEVYGRAEEAGEVDKGTENLHADITEAVEDRSVVERDDAADTRYIKLNVKNKVYPITFDHTRADFRDGGPAFLERHIGYFQNQRSKNIVLAVEAGTRTKKSGEVVEMVRLIDQRPGRGRPLEKDQFRESTWEIITVEEDVYFVHDGKEFVAVDGKEVEIEGFEDIDAFVHPGRSGQMAYIVTEGKSGAKLGDGSNELRAIEDARNTVRRLGIEKTKEAINKGIDRAGLSPRYEDENTIKEPADPDMTAEDVARQLWDEQVAELPEYEEETVHMITGALLDIWDKLPTSKIEVKRALTEEGETILGRVISEKEIDNVLERLGASRDLEEIDISTVPSRIVDKNWKAMLDNSWILQRSTVSGDYRIELKKDAGPDLTTNRQQLLDAGLISEIIQYNTRYFVPVGERALPTLQDLTKHNLNIVKMLPPDSEPIEEMYRIEERLDIDPVPDEFMVEVFSLAAELAAPARYTGLRTKAAARFTDIGGDERIETRDVTNLETLGHEVAHVIDYRINNNQYPSSIKERFPDLEVGEMELREQLKAVAKQVRPPEEGELDRYRNKHTELMADFYTMYLLNTEMARNLAPDVAQGLDMQIRQNPDLHQKIQDIIQKRHEMKRKIDVSAIRPIEEVERLLPSEYLTDDYKDNVKTIIKSWSRLFRLRQIEAGYRKIDWSARFTEEQLEDMGAAVEEVKNIRTGKTAEEIQEELTPEMRQALAEYRYFQEKARQDLNRFMREVVGDEEYVTYLEDYLLHFYENKPKRIKEFAYRWTKRVPSAMQRTIPTLEDAVEAGLVPRTQNIAELHYLWHELNWKGALNRAFVHELTKIANDEGEPIIQKSNQAPPHWPLVDHPAINKYYARQARDGTTILWEGKAAVDPEAYKITKQVFEQPFHWKPLQIIEAFNAYAKGLSLKLSGFHFWNLTESAQAALAKITQPLRGFFTVGEEVKEVDESAVIRRTHQLGLDLISGSPEALRDAIMHGVVFDPIPDAHMRRINQDLRKLEAHTRKIPGAGSLVRKMRQANEWYDRKLWNEYYAGLKAITYYEWAKEALSDQKVNAKDASPQKIREIKEEVARMVNDAFGGQEWESHFWATPRVRQAMKLLWLSPDYTYTNMRIFGRTLYENLPFKKNKDPVVRKFGARYWISMLISMLAAINIANRALTGRWAWENEPGRRTDIDVTPIIHAARKIIGTYDPDDERRYYAAPGKQAREILRYFDDPITYLFGSKFSPVVRTALEQTTGTQAGPGGWPMPWREGDMPFYQEMDERVRAVYEKFVPFSLRGNNFAFTMPMRRGMGWWQAQKGYEDLWRARVDPSWWQRTYQQIAPGSQLLRLKQQLDEAAVLNGLDPAEQEKQAVSKLRTEYYGNLWNAVDRGDREEAEHYANILIQLGVDATGAQRSGEARPYVTDESVQRALMLFAE